MEWLDLPEEKRPALITIYMDQPDTAGHEFGPDSDGVNQALIYVDSMINYLMTSLYQRDLMDCVNLMIVADHGMQQLYEDKRIFLDQYFDVKGMRIFSAAVGRIMLENSTLSAPQVVDKMKCLNGTNFRVYEPKNIPKRLHYAKSYRIGDVIIDSAPGSMVFPDKKSAEDDWDEQGDHGFDFRTPSMHAIFFGHGPGFKEGVSIQPFQNIELYNLMADLMQLPSRAPTNGTKGALYHILSNPPPDVETSMKSLSSCVKKLIYGFCGDQCAQSDDRPVCQPDEVISLPEELATSLCSIALCNSTTIYDKSLYKPKFTQFQFIVVCSSLVCSRSPFSPPLPLALPKEKLSFQRIKRDLRCIVNAANWL
uniref:Uncharacterized protein n=1 Tax=Plectus sambesii TaxID=2011161 RepID=A0A914XR42_9BILA